MIATVLDLTGAALVAAGVLVRDRRGPGAGSALISVGSWVIFLERVLAHSFFGQAVWAFNGVLFAYDWWRTRRNGRWKRAAKELGAKSKARVDALVRQLTPSPIPSPAGAGS